MLSEHVFQSTRVAVSEHVVQPPISLMSERTLWIDCRVSVKRTIEFDAVKPEKRNDVIEDDRVSPSRSCRRVLFLIPKDV